MDAFEVIERPVPSAAPTTDVEKGPSARPRSLANSGITASAPSQRLHSLQVTDISFDCRFSKSQIAFHADQDANQVPEFLPELAECIARIYEYSYTAPSEEFVTGHPQAPQAWDILSQSLEQYISVSDRLRSDDPSPGIQLYELDDLHWQWKEHVRDHSSYSSILFQSISWKQKETPIQAAPTTGEYSAQRRDLDPFVTNSAYLKCCALDKNQLVVFHRSDPSVSIPEATTTLRLADILTRNGSASLCSDGSRSKFTKLLLLDFFQSRIGPLAATVKHQDLVWRQDEHDLLLGRIISEHFVHKIRYATTLCEIAKSLARTVEQIESSLRIDARDNGNDRLSRDLEDYLLGIRHSCTRVTELAAVYLGHHQRNWDGYRDTLNASESEGIKRLTILAAAFLPLSLSASILSMTTRFVNLNLLLYDFLGVFVLLTSIAILFYFVIVGVLRWIRWGKSQSMEFSSWRVEALATQAERLVDPHEIMDRWATVVYYGNYICPWTIVTVSFIVGMVQDVILGLKILAFGFVGYLSLVILSFGAVLCLSAV